MVEIKIAQLALIKSRCLDNGNANVANELCFVIIFQENKIKNLKLKL